MKFNFRSCVRVIFLILIFVLWFTGNIKIWGPLLGIGILFIPFLGRVYCGWVCPISTAITFSKPLFPRPLLGKYRKSLFTIKARLLAFIVSVTLLIIFIRFDFLIPFFIFLIPVGVLIAVLFGESAWHRICFIGTIYSLFGYLSRVGYYFVNLDCTHCRSCQKICPNECLEIEPVPRIVTKECLLCGKCKEVCATNSIRYGSLRGKIFNVSMEEITGVADSDRRAE